MLKKILLVVLATLLTSLGIQPAYVNAGIKPDAPKFKINVSADESTFMIKISKTAEADGYRIYAKEPGSSKFCIIATIKKNGKILVGEFDCNVYEIGVVNVIKVDLNHCNVINK